MTSWKKLAGGAALSVMAAAIVQPASAQVTTSDVRGVVLSADGSPVSDATVTVQNTGTGLSRTTTTGANGSFDVRNLQIGGPYTVTASVSGQQPTQIENIYLTLGDTTNLQLALTGASVAETVVVTATLANAAELAIGPAASFDQRTLETAPAINRNLTDVLRIDPRIFVDESRGDVNAVQCGGKNSRFNSLTLDGVRMNDNFGLNSNGYPTERIPFSYDAIEQVAVELAPFDVQYGGFSACNINAVTKSGTNEFHGYGFFDYTDDGLRADSLEGDDIQSGSYDEMRYGVGIGGPIVKDKLFFFAAYEKLEGSNLFDRGPIGSGAVNEVDITQAEIDEIARIAREVYGYDPGDIPNSADNEDEKLLVKLDWNISDRHRAAFTYNWNDGFNISESDSDNSELEFSNHLYERGAELTAYVGALYSDWTDNFSTEFRVGYSELLNRQISQGGTDFGEITIETDDVDVYLGADDSRHANQLSYETLNIALKGFYTHGYHNLSFGYEREDLDVFNLFVQHVQTEIDFDGSPNTAGAFDPAIENFRLGLADNVNYNNAPSGNTAEAAADFGYAVNSVYAQDEYEFSNGLTLIGGLRYDWYTTDDAPAANAAFAADYGFSNSQTIDGKGLLQPRLGFQMDVSPELDLRGGIGLYSGGNPNVWLSNTYQATNTAQFGVDGGAYGIEQNSGPSLFTIPYTMCEAGVPTGPGWCVPTVLANAVANSEGSNFEINYLDPTYDIPRDWKMALGATYFLDMENLGGEYVVTADLLYSVLQDSAVWIRADLEQTGTIAGPDGGTYPVFTSVREPAFVLTNSSSDAKSLLLSTSISKSYDFGLDWSLGYAYSDAEDVHPMTSSVAFTNYVSRAFVDPQDVSAAPSEYNTAHRFTALMNYERAFFGDNLTKFSAFGQLSSGRPYSITYDGNVSSFDIFDGTPFLDGEENTLYPGFSRNDQEGSWWGKVDIKIEQEFPGFAGGHKTSAFLIIDNFTNLLNDEWGILREPGFPATCEFGTVCESRIGDASRYEIRLGVRYDF